MSKADAESTSRSSLAAEALRGQRVEPVTALCGREIRVANGEWPRRMRVSPTYFQESPVDSGSAGRPAQQIVKPRISAKGIQPRIVWTIDAQPRGVRIGSLGEACDCLVQLPEPCVH